MFLNIFRNRLNRIVWNLDQYKEVKITEQKCLYEILITHSRDHHCIYLFQKGKHTHCSVFYVEFFISYWKHDYNWESHYFIYRLGDGIIIIQLFTIKYAWKSCFIYK